MKGVEVNATGGGTGSITVALHGSIGHADTDELRRVLVEMIMRRRPGHIEVDVHDVTVLDSLAIGALRGAYHIACDTRQSFVVNTADRSVRELLLGEGVPAAHTCGAAVDGNPAAVTGSPPRRPRNRPAVARRPVAPTSPERVASVR